MIIHTKRDEFATHIIEKIKKLSFEDFLPKEKVLARKIIMFEKENNYNFRKQSLEKFKQDMHTFDKIKFPEFQCPNPDPKSAPPGAPALT